MSTSKIGVSVLRKEALTKVTGTAKYNMDYVAPGLLYAKMLTSTVAHANLKRVDISLALKEPGVQNIITGSFFPVMTGTIIEDRPPLATNKVRYYGEPIAVVIANSLEEAIAAQEKIIVEYEPLPVVNSVTQALAAEANLIHSNLNEYVHVIEDVAPQPGTNVNDLVKVRKGNMEIAWATCDEVVEAIFILPQTDHIAMEPRNVWAEILPDGIVNIHSSTQAPFSIRELISKYFGVNEGNIIVHTPLVGGGFGGKAAVQLELIAYLASLSVNGRPVKLFNTREEDIITSPCHLGLEAKVKLGATKDGLFKAAELIYNIDCGAYADISSRLARTMAADGTGPYNIENLYCDVRSVYTNHPYVTSFRGFGHSESAFAIERTIDLLAAKLNIDPLEIRLKNALNPGNTSPTGVALTKSYLGDLPACITKLKEIFNWEEGTRLEIGGGKIRAKGISCLWKTSNSPTDAGSGVVLTMNSDGSINISCGAIEIGPGMKTTLAQLLAEKLQMDMEQIHIRMDMNTGVDPHHWKTVASMTTYMVGQALLNAAEDLIEQLLNIGGIALKCSPQDLAISNSQVYLKADPTCFITFNDICQSYKYPNGNSVGGPIIGRGNFVMRHLTPLNPDTGQGKSGPYWTVGAQAVELEFDTNNYTYRLVRVGSVIDAGKVINPKTARGVVMGGICMGLGLGSREEFIYNGNGKTETTSLRTYKVMRIGEVPEYIIEFIETPQADGPYGARGLSEHGIIGIPAALANALSTATKLDINQLPVTPELIWQLKQKEVR